MKKTRVLLAFTLAFVCAALFTVCALAAAPGLPDLHAEVGGQTVLPAEVGGETWFFLPSFADPAAVELCFDAPEGGVSFAGEPAESSEAVDLTARAAYDAGTGVYTLPYAAGEETGALRFMKSENTGAMFITVADPAYGRAWIESSEMHANDAAAHTEVSMRLVGAEADVIYDGALTYLKGRGNTTWNTAAKKPYQIKLDKKTDLLASGVKANKNKTWILLANALDKTLMKNAFGFDLARYLGREETPEYTWVDLYFDGEYRGLYQLAEKVQINSGRVEITELEEHNTVSDKAATARGVNRFGNEYQYNPTAVCDTAEITGGYLLEQDNAFYRGENSWFRLSDGRVLVVKSPESCTKEQIEYISEFVQEAATAAEHNVCGGRSVIELVDIDSLAAVYLVNEYMRNVDYHYSSTYFFLPAPGDAGYEHKLYSGPAWDFDTSLGNRTESEYFRTPYGLYRADAPWFKGSVVQAAIKEKAKALNAAYGVIFSETPAESGSLKSLSWYRARLDAAQRMNFTLWPFDNSVNTFALPSYQENYDYVRNFLLTRHADIMPQLLNRETPDYAALQACLRGEHAIDSREKAPTCTAPGHTGRSCTVCFTVFEGEGELPALGHTDANGDKVCDRCGEYVGSGPQWLSWFFRLYARLVAFFRAIFG